MREKLLIGAIILGVGAFGCWPWLQTTKVPSVPDKPVVALEAAETTKTVFVKTDELPWVKPEAPVNLSDTIIELSDAVDNNVAENNKELVLMDAVPHYFKNLDKQDNAFSQTILGGYCLSSCQNANLAAQYINNAILQPQTTFSFNTAAGPYKSSRGYGTGTVIQGDRYVPGTGGGVCRTSTALYNAARDAGLEIVESHRHTMPVGYAKPGKDAAVSYGVIDLKIRNNRSNPIQILTKTEDGILYIAFIEHNFNQPQNHEIEIHNINPAISDEISLEESI
ncbi:MAG: VanW family protein [Crenarchaeota archaeon]|nr:VanW family protein [Thermoproteota archaeon]